MSPGASGTESTRHQSCLRSPSCKEWTCMGVQFGKVSAETWRSWEGGSPSVTRPKTGGGGLP